MHSLDLSCCRVVDCAQVAALSAVTRLHSLNLNGCEDVEDAGVSALAALTGLKMLSLHNCCKVLPHITVQHVTLLSMDRISSESR